MTVPTDHRVRALLFGLSNDLASDLSEPLASFCTIDKEDTRLSAVANCPAQIIFCGADMAVVAKLRQTRPDASIIVVSRHPEVGGWLDSIEAGASDYCAAPFEAAQVQWILETRMRAAQIPVSAQ